MYIFHSLASEFRNARGPGLASTRFALAPARRASNALASIRVRSGSRGGQTLFSLIFILTVVFGLIGTTFAVSSYLQSILSAQRSFSEQAKEAASAGVEDALIRIVRDPNWLPSTSCSAGPLNAFDVVVDDITVCVRVTDASTLSPQQRRRRKIDSSAVVRDSTRRICAIVEVSASGGVKVLSREERPNC